MLGSARPLNGLTEEHWLAPSGVTMIGVELTVTNGRTTEYEFSMTRDVVAHSRMSRSRRARQKRPSR